MVRSKSKVALALEQLTEDDSYGRGSTVKVKEFVTELEADGIDDMAEFVQNLNLNSAHVCSLASIYLVVDSVLIAL
jgi:hypothetical protein